MEDTTPRRLMKQIGICSLSFEMTSHSDPAIDNFSISTNNEGWEHIPQQNLAVGVAVVANRQYIDLAGYAMKDLTTFVQSVDIQKSRDPLGTNQLIVYVYDFLTTRRITTEELSNFTGAEIPGFVESTVDLMEMIYGEHQTLANNAQIPGTFITTMADSLGSGNPTASDRLHWTRVYSMSPAAVGAATLTIYSTNLVSQAITGKEKDLVYIERLRRAYTQDAGRNV
ncbi:MAG: hypothetical protein [Circular genetic element sp.]|jgi:hypothetical protein|nr:MAG: hypothetical protein [Circular genetic element sp.]